SLGHADLAARGAVAAKEDGPVVELEPLGRDGAEVLVVHDRSALLTREIRDHDGRAWRGVEHAQDPDGDESALLLPGVGAGVLDLIVGLVGDDAAARATRSAPH